MVRHRDPVHLLAYAGERIRQFHVKDLKYNGTTPTFADVGTGVIDFARIFKAAGNPREHEYIVERDDAGTAALQTAKAGFDYLSKLRFRRWPGPRRGSSRPARRAGPASRAG